MDHHLRALILHSFIQKINCTIIFFHPDCTVGTGITPVHAALAARGLYRRWGISPRPEDKYAVVLALYDTPCPAKMQPLSAEFFYLLLHSNFLLYFDK